MSMSCSSAISAISIAAMSTATLNCSTRSPKEIGFVFTAGATDALKTKRSNRLRYKGSDNGLLTSMLPMLPIEHVRDRIATTWGVGRETVCQFFAILEGEDDYFNTCYLLFFKFDEKSIWITLKFSSRIRVFSLWDLCLQRHVWAVGFEWRRGDPRWWYL